ncbi:hypothetical protein J3E68DRAFT_20052 [Trichoderma sp. SZMC 28012]
MLTSHVPTHQPRPSYIRQRISRTSKNSNPGPGCITPETSCLWCLISPRTRCSQLGLKGTRPEDSRRSFGFFALLLSWVVLADGLCATARAGDRGELLVLLFVVFGSLFLEQKVGVSATALRRIRPRAGRSR